MPSVDLEGSATPSPDPHVREEQAPDPGARPQWRADFKAGAAYSLKVFVVARLALFVVGVVGIALLPANQHAGLPGWQLIEGPGWSNLFTAWERWDALWFLQIATKGYSQGDFSAAFFPLYPLLIRGVSPLLGGHPFAAALLISNAAYAGALVVVYELTRGEFGHQMARRTVVLMAVFPTAYFFVAPYSESLFTLLAAGCLLAARRRRWEVAGILGALAALTRSIGIMLAVPLTIEAFLQFRAMKGERKLAPFVISLFWSGFVGVGTLCYLYYWSRVNGNWLTPLSDQNGWLREFSWPWQTLKGGTDVAFDFIGIYSGGYHQLDWLFAMLGLMTIAWVAVRTRVTFALYAFVGFVVPLFLVFGGRPFMSLPRFMLPLFPIYWALARFSERFKAQDVVVAISAAFLGLMTLLFVNWYWVF